MQSEVEMNKYFEAIETIVFQAFIGAREKVG